MTKGPNRTYALLHISRTQNNSVYSVTDRVNRNYCIVVVAVEIVVEQLLGNSLIVLSLNKKLLKTNLITCL